MDTWAVVFLGVIAVASLVQAAFLIGLAVHGLKLSRRVQDMQERLDTRLEPAVEQMTRASRNVAELTDVAVVQMRRVDEMLADTAAKVETTTGEIQRLILRPLGPLLEIAAILKGVRRGIEVFQRLGAADDKRRGKSQRYVDDEHLFI